MTDPSHILVVDDDVDIRRMLQLLLSGSGYRVSVAATGEEALAYLDLVTPDLILLDLNLPGMNGRQVTERVKADTSKPFIPIVLLTAQGDQASKVTALDAGADEFLVKPVELSELLARLRAMLRLQRSQRLLRSEQRKTELLLHLTRELGTSLDLEQLLVHFLDRLSDAVGAIRGSIILVGDTNSQLFSSTRNRPVFPIEHIMRKGVAGWVAQNRSALIIDETRTDQRWVAETPIQRSVRSVASVPVLRDERVLGVITLVHHTPGYFTEEHLELLGSVAAQTAIALENASYLSAIRELERREQERLRDVFRRYVSPQVVEEVLAGTVEFGEPAEREVVVLFADLRDYTTLAEGMNPRVLVEQVLNRYFTAMTEVLYRHGGTIDKFLGDGLIGLFGVPIARADDIERAITTAVDLQLAFDDLNRIWTEELGRSIGMGIGMSYGRAVVGNVGSHQRVDYTVVGDVVNTASRLNGLARPGQIIVSHHLVDALASVAALTYPLTPIGSVMLKGKHEPHLVYEIAFR